MDVDAKEVEGSDGKAKPSDGKHPRDEGEGAKASAAEGQPPAKQMKIEGAAAQATQATPSEANGDVEGEGGKKVAGGGLGHSPQKSKGTEFKLSSAMREMLVNFLIRFSFLCGESSDRRNLYSTTMGALSTSLAM